MRRADLFARFDAHLLGRSPSIRSGESGAGDAEGEITHLVRKVRGEVVDLEERRRFRDAWEPCHFCSAPGTVEVWLGDGMLALCPDDARLVRRELAERGH